MIRPFLKKLLVPIVTKVLFSSQEEEGPVVPSFTLRDRSNGRDESYVTLDLFRTQSLTPVSLRKFGLSVSPQFSTSELNLLNAQTLSTINLRKFGLQTAPQTLTSELNLLNAQSLEIQNLGRL